jgi:flagellar basal body-associated protein FliL
MLNPPSFAAQPIPQKSGNALRKNAKTILILAFVVVIVVLLSFAVVLSGRSISQTQPSTPAPTTTPKATGNNSEPPLTLVHDKAVCRIGELAPNAALTERERL